tara:strand:- start:502 stop:960 length:459 start_codon:yes stop_codon:yes gene_type:complete
MKQILAVLAIGILAMTGTAHAAGSSDAPEAKDLAEMVQARNMIKGEHYNQAIPLLNKVIARQPKNADALNLLAYSQRKTDDFQASLANYKKALAIDPSHKDAHEYIGELYLRMGDLANAEKHLKRLDNICFLGCEQFTELKAAITAYKQKKG